MSVHQFLVPGSTSPPAAGQLAWPSGSGRLVFAAGGSALAVSHDGGASFQEDARVGAINHVAVSLPLPSAPLRPAVYALGDGVMFVSLDGGGSWKADAGPIHANWGGAVSAAGNAQAPSVLIVSPRSPLEVFLIANANAGKTVSPLASASLFASVYHVQHHFAYPDIAGTIWDSWWDGDRWNLQQLNGPGGLTPNAPSTNTGPFATVYHNQHHFAYLDGAGTIWDSWWDGDNDQWKLQQINGANGVTPNGPPAVANAFVSVYHDQHHFAYRDSAGTIWDSWWNENSWQLQQINAGGGKTPDGPPAVDGPFVTVYHDQHHFAYLDAAGTIWDSWWNADSWQLQQINAAGGKTPDGPAAVKTPFVSVYHNQHHFAYRDSAGTIWDSWWNGDSWQLQQINAGGDKTPDGPPAVDGPFVTVYHDQHHFAYVDAAGTIWDSWWNADSWQLQQINAAGGKTPDGPAAVKTPFVSVYHHQHHFAYRDSAGTIWDSWWNGDRWQLQQINAAGGKTPDGPAAVDRPFVAGSCSRSIAPTERLPTARRRQPARSSRYTRTSTTSAIWTAPERSSTPGGTETSGSYNRSTAGPCCGVATIRNFRIRGNQRGSESFRPISTSRTRTRGACSSLRHEPGMETCCSMAPSVPKPT